MQYLLPCPNCGQKNSVDAGRAGQTTTCTCGQSIEIPSVRHLRNFEAAQEEPAARWSVGHGLAFLGCTLTLAAVAFGAALWFAGSAKYDPAAVGKEIDALTVHESFVRLKSLESQLPINWAQRARSQNLPAHLRPASDVLAAFEGSGPSYLAPNEAKRVRDSLRNWAMLKQWVPLAVIVAVTGLMLIVAAFLIGVRQPARQRSQPATAGRMRGGRV